MNDPFFIGREKLFPYSGFDASCAKVRFHSQIDYLKLMMKNEEKSVLMPGEKYCLTVAEAAAYFEVGPKKIRQLAEEHMDDRIFTRHGVKLLVVRPAFENFLAQTSQI